MQKNTTKEAFFNLGCLEVHLSLSTLMLVSLNTCWVVMVVDFIFLSDLFCGEDIFN